MKLEHIGIAVKDLAKSENIFEDLLQTSVYKKEEVVNQSVLTAFLKVDNTKIELLKSTHPDGPIARFLATHGEGVHHLAFEVENIHQEIDRLRKAGYTFVSEQPLKGADNKWVVFLHPRSTNKILIELCQEMSEGDSI